MARQKIKSLDRQTLRYLEGEFLPALNKLGEELGVKFSLGSGRFDSTHVHYKLNVDVVGAGGVVESPERKNWKTHATFYGFEQTDLDGVFTSQGTQFRISGIKPSRYKFPVSAKRVKDNKGFKFPADQVLRALGRTAKVLPAGFGNDIVDDDDEGDND